MSQISSNQKALGVPKHPLDPLNADEIIHVSSLLKAQSPDKSLHFKIITIIEPPKTKLRPFLKAERRGATNSGLPRIASSLTPYSRQHGPRFPRPKTTTIVAFTSRKTSVYSLPCRQQFGRAVRAVTA